MDKKEGELQQNNLQCYPDLEILTIAKVDAKVGYQIPMGDIIAVDGDLGRSGTVPLDYAIVSQTPM